MSKIPEKVISLAKRMRDEGGRAMLVGGCVRDEIRGVEIKDWDVEVYGIQPEHLESLLKDFGTVNTVGAVFTVFKIGTGLDVSIPRREKKTAKGHKGFAVEGDPEMSFEDACRRRDFTVNAILKDPLTGEIEDPFHGQEDITKKILRAVDPDTFVEDSLRVLRAVQFAARFGFEIEPETFELCKTIDLTDLPNERVWGEIEKLLLKAEKPGDGLRLMYDLGAVDQLFPELNALVGVPQEPEWHPEGNVDVHTMLVMDEAAKLIEDLSYPKKISVMLGAVCHDLGKPATTAESDGRIRSLGHDEAGVEPTISFLDRLNIHTFDGYDVREQIVQLVRYHLKPGEFFKVRDKVGDGAFRRLARKVEPDLLFRIAKADSLGRNAKWVPREKWFDADAQEWFIERARELEVEEKGPQPILMGRHLIEMGLEPSKEFGDILDAVFEKQLDGEITTLEEAANEARKIIGGTV
jgi:tRNA nucleotidyltransferase (CCA-adding enzyme)